MTSVMNESESAVAPIIVGVDGSPSSARALRTAAELADVLDRPVRVITAWTPPSGCMPSYDVAVWCAESVAEEVADLTIKDAFPQQQTGLTGEAVEGSAAGILIEQSRTGYMVVVGSRGEGGFGGLLLGSVSSAVTEHAHCPVLVVR